MEHENVSIGVLACTRAELRPTGQVVIDGRVYEARSEGDWLEAGVQVTVLRVETFYLIVRPATEEDARGIAQAEQERQRHVERVTHEQERARRLSERRQIATGALMGLLLGIALLIWVRSRHAGEVRLLDVLFPLVGVPLGAAYVVGYRTFYRAVREEISERWPASPGRWGRSIFPCLGLALGTLFGGALASTVGAVIGGVVGALFLAPLMILMLLLIGGIFT